MGLRVRALPRAFPRQRHTGIWGGQTQSLDHSRKADFTIRSSREW
jgi:hypothetical protein